MTHGKGYYAYVIVGLIAVVAISVVAGLSSENGTGEGVLPIVIGAVVVFVVGLLILQWRGIFKAEAAAQDEQRELAASALADATTVKTPEAMMELLAVEQADPERHRRGRRGRSSVMRINQSVVTVVTLVCIGLGYLGATGKLPNLGNPVVYVPFALLPFAMAYVWWMLSRSRAASNDLMAPMGLQIAEMPKPGVAPDPFRGPYGMRTTVSGGTVMRGHRHGRDVAVVLDGSRHRTTIAARTPPFKVTAKRQRLRVDGHAPAGLAELVAGIGASKHWKKLESVEGEDGEIVATRRVDTGQGWLWDLWLAERIADRLR